MNKNIEFIIPNKLAAVKFSYIPFISEIDYKPDPDTPAYTEDLRITDQGVLLLNKDRPGYDVLQKIFRQVVPLPYTRLRWQRKSWQPKAAAVSMIIFICSVLMQSMSGGKKSSKGGVQ